MRSLSTQLLRAITGAESGACVLWICEIAHASLAAPLRFVNNDEAITSEGNVYEAIGFDVDLPDNRDGASFRLDLILDNVDQWLTPTIRSIGTGFDIRIALVTAADPVADPLVFDNVEVEFDGLTFEAIAYTATEVRGTLGESGLGNAKFPAHDLNPFDFRGAF